MIEEQFAEGEDLEAEQLAEYGFTETTNDNFFEIFDEKIESIIEEIQGKETSAEKAALRMMDDVYRQTLLKAETAVATGSQTIPKAIEEAVREFAKKGINCIEYRDGRRVNIADYVYMALRTANTRANLLGQAKQRMALGIDTVRVSSYNACSETCLPWQGGIYIDDVFATFDGEISGDKGKSKNGNWYTLLSVAVRAGLFHPNCRHSLTTYTGNGKDSPKVDEEKARENYKLEQQQRALERKLRYWKRRYEAESDPVLKDGLKNQVKKARSNLKSFVDEHKDVLRRDPWREKTYTKTVEKITDDDIINKKAANISQYNTGRQLQYDSNKDFRIELSEFPKTTNDGLSLATAKVAELGGKTHTEHLLMVDLSNGNHSYYESGDSESVGGAEFWQFLNNSNGKYAFVHNHNTDGYFSETDMRTFLSHSKIKVLVATRIDGISYVAIKENDLNYRFTYDKLYEAELKEINDMARKGEITPAERTNMREEIIVDNLLKDYTKGMIVFEDGKRMG